MRRSKRQSSIIFKMHVQDRTCTTSLQHQTIGVFPLHVIGQHMFVLTHLSSFPRSVLEHNKRLEELAGRAMEARLTFPDARKTIMLLELIYTSPSSS